MRYLCFLSIAILMVFGCGEVNYTTVAPAEPSQTWKMTDFKKIDSLNPILVPSQDMVFNCPLTGKEVRWETRNVLNPTAIVKDEQIHLLYRAQDRMGTSRIGLALSRDGLNFEKMPAPVLYPDEDQMKIYEWHHEKKGRIRPNQDYFDGVEDPRVVESVDGLYVMTYTAYDGRTARLCIASSRDLVNWTKHGLVLKDPKYQDTWSKAGAIVCGKQHGKYVATKIEGKYWMYYGDTDLFMATSDDLIQWEAAENDENGQRITVLHPRKGYFDSRLVEPGPYGLITDEGILLIYNGSNASNFNDRSLPTFTYAAGQALFDRNAPYKLLDRLNNDFLRPDKDYEKVGEVNEVCFVEGLVNFKEEWFLYYGTADSKIAVAVSP